MLCCHSVEMKRGKAWRRAKDATKETKHSRIDAIRDERRPSADSWKSYPAEKTWKKVYTRSEKMARAAQLGFDYPRKTSREVLAGHTDVDSDREPALHLQP